jgi:Flp pilus assembly pilin Flp
MCGTRPRIVPKLRKAFATLCAGGRGDTAVEYVLLLGLVALPAIPAFLGAGRSLVHEFEQMRALLLLQVP